MMLYAFIFAGVSSIIIKGINRYVLNDEQGSGT